MAQFRYVGDQPVVFSDLSHPDGSTVEAQPGLSFEVAHVHNPAALLHDLLVAVDAEAKRMVEAARKALDPDPEPPVAAAKPEPPAPVEAVSEPVADAA